MKARSSLSERLDVRGLCLIAALAAACTFDASKLRAHASLDGAVERAIAPDVGTSGSDGPIASSPDAADATGGSDGANTSLADAAEAQGAGDGRIVGPPDAATVPVDSGGFGADGGPDAVSDVPGATSPEASADRPLGIGEDAADSAPATTDGASTDRGANSVGDGNDADDARDTHTSGNPDLVPDTAETGGNDGADSPAASDTRPDAPSPDAPSGTVTCPTTINGSLNPTDLVQIGRLDRVAPASTCGMTKAFPGNAADSTYDHLYDVYRFVNLRSLPVCFNFTLTYPGNQLYAAAYTSFRPTNIATGYVGDVGGALTVPQTMGITVNAGRTIDVVVYAIGQGTGAAGSYTLSCSTQ